MLFHRWVTASTGSGRGVPIPHSRSLFTRIPHPAIFSSLSRISFLFSVRATTILGDPGAASRDDGIFMGESLLQERESPWALTLTERVPEAFEIPPSDWPEKYFSGQSAKRNSRATLMSSYTRLFSSSNAVVAWPVQRKHF